MYLNTLKDSEFKVSLSGPQFDPARGSTACEGAATDFHCPLGVLVIEDQRLMLKAMEQGLQRQGFVVWTAPNGREGVELYRRFGAKIDIVLSDVRMPVLDGPKTLDAIREINPIVRFCFMTSDTRASTQANLVERGALCVFTKPFQSVAGVAMELWKLAKQAPESCAGMEVEDDELAGLQNALSQFEWSARSSLIRWTFSPLIRSVVGFGSLFGKPRSESPRSVPPA